MGCSGCVLVWFGRILLWDVFFLVCLNEFWGVLGVFYLF